MLNINQIRRDGGTQARAELNENTINDYQMEMKSGAKFPPVVVFYDGESYWLADGFHRVEAALRAGFVKIHAEVKQGTRRDAILYSVQANSSHGLRRTNEDKRRAVRMLLEDDEWCKWSDREIARRCGVSHQFVNNWRPSLSTVDSERRYVTKHGTESVMHFDVKTKPAAVVYDELTEDYDELPFAIPVAPPPPNQPERTILVTAWISTYPEKSHLRAEHGDVLFECAGKEVNEWLATPAYWARHGFPNRYEKETTIGWATVAGAHIKHAYENGSMEPMCGNKRAKRSGYEVLWPPRHDDRRCKKCNELTQPVTD